MKENNYKYLSIYNAAFIDKNMYFAEVLTNEIYKYDISIGKLTHIGEGVPYKYSCPFVLRGVFREKSKIIWAPNDGVDFVVIYDVNKEKLYKQSVGTTLCSSGTVYVNGKIYIVPKYLSQPLIEIVIASDEVVIHDGWSTGLIKYRNFKDNEIVRFFYDGTIIHMQLKDNKCCIDFDIVNESMAIVETDKLLPIQFYGVTKYGNLIYFEGNIIKELDFSNYQIVNEFECDENVISRIYAIDDKCIVWNENKKRFSMYSIREKTLLGRLKAPENWTNVSGRRGKWPLLGTCRLYQNNFYLFPYGANAMLCISDTFESVRAIPLLLADNQLQGFLNNELINKNIVIEDSSIGLKKYIMALTKY